MPLPDSEAPEQSLGDCAICMDAIVVDARARGQGEKEKLGTWDAQGTSGGGLLSAMQMGIEGAGARKVYSLAPCHHLFVSAAWLFFREVDFC